MDFKDKVTESEDDITRSTPDSGKTASANGQNDRRDVGSSEAQSDSQTPDAQEAALRYKNKRQVVKAGILGLFIGLAVIVPGVSGSAVAIIFRLYEKLLYALGNIFKRFKMCFLFLLPILAGAAAGFLLGFFGVKELLNLLPFAVVALFAGLMLGSFPAVTDQLKGEKPALSRVLLFAAGLVLPIIVSVCSVFMTEGANSLGQITAVDYVIFIALGYAVAVTQLVPGLSATALLMMFGWFTPIMNSVSLGFWREFPQVFAVYLCLAAGFAAGIFTVSKLLSGLMKRKRVPTFCAVAGLSLGSVLSMFFNPDIYAVYKTWSGAVMIRDLCIGTVLFAAGVALAYFFVRYERRKNVG